MARSFQIRKSSEVTVTDDSKPKVTMDELYRKTKAEIPKLAEVAAFLTMKYDGVLVGRGVMNPELKRVEMQVRPATRKIGAFGSHSSVVSDLINRYYPGVNSVQEHSLVIECRDLSGNSREIYVQEGNYQEVLDAERYDSKQPSTVGRSFHESFKASIVGSLNGGLVYVCQLDNPNSILKMTADAQPLRRQVVAQAREEAAPQKEERVEEPEVVKSEVSTLSPMQKEAARRQKERKEQIQDAKRRRREIAKNGHPDV